MEYKGSKTGKTKLKKKKVGGLYNQIKIFNIKLQQLRYFGIDIRIDKPREESIYPETDSHIYCGGKWSFQETIFGQQIFLWGKKERDLISTSYHI